MGTFDPLTAGPGSIRVSIVAPCYNEEAVIQVFYNRASECARAQCGSRYQIVLVDDGSRDATWSLIEEISARDPHVVGVRLRRNYGHQMAVMAGLRVARGDRVLLIDADLQDPPELLCEMMSLMDDGADVVFGKRVERSGETLFKRATASAFYRLLGRLSDVPIPQDVGDFRLMNRTVVDILLSLPEQHRFTRGLVSWIGGRQEGIAYHRDARFAGATKYTPSKMLRFAIDALTSFSIRPLRIASWVGLVSAAIALGLIGYSSVQWARGQVVDGWTSIFIAVTALAAVQLFVLGIMGEYIGRLVQESKRRPLYLIDEVVGGTRVSSAAGALGLIGRDISTVADSNLPSGVSDILRSAGPPGAPHRSA